jgi:hypothetical protein
MKRGLKAAIRKCEKSQRGLWKPVQNKDNSNFVLSEDEHGGMLFAAMGGGIGGLNNAKFFSPAHALSGWYEIYC